MSRATAARGALRLALLRAHAAWRDRRPEDAIVLSCEPRGGSTWLGELLSEARPSATVWEPLHLRHVPEAAALGLAWRQPIPADADWPEARALLGRILSGRVVNSWTTSADPLRRHIAAERLIVKFCRANAMLPWLARQFAFRRKPVHFLRHPFAVAASQLRMGNFRTHALDSGLTSGRFAETRADAVDYIRGLGSEPERLVALWCVANAPALDDPEAGRLWVRMRYEDLVLDPEREIERLFAEWGEPPPGVALSRVRQASRMTQDGALAADPGAQIAKWRDDFAPAEIRAMQAVLDRFGIRLYSDEPA